MVETVQVCVTSLVLVASGLVVYVFWRRSRPQSPDRLVTLLNDTDKYNLPLIQKTVLTHNTRRFRFGLPSEKHVLGLPAGQHTYLSAKVDGKLVVRPYSPTSNDEVTGYVELVVKIYRRGDDPKFPDGGKMSQYLDSLSIGHTVDFRGPTGHIVYKGRGVFSIRADKKLPPVLRSFRSVSMIAGGTGITPMLQIIDSCVKNTDHDVSVRLIFANRSHDDILCKSELDELASRAGSRFKVSYTVSQCSPGQQWPFCTGRVDEKMIKDHLFPPSDDSVVLLCGPPAMITGTCTPCLDALGYPVDNRLIF